MTVSIELNNLANLQNETTAVNTINDNNNSIETAFASALNTSGDVMSGNLDMNSKQILNLPAPVSNYDPIRLIDVTTINDNGITVSPLPSGGTVSQVLTKNSSTNFDTSWQTPQVIPSAGTTGQVLAKNSNSSGDFGWTSTPQLTSINTSTGVLSLPGSTDTLVGAATSNILSNKSIDGGSNTLTNIPVSALNGGTSASSATFWNGAGTWVAPPSGTFIFLEQLTGNNTNFLRSTQSWSSYSAIQIELFNILPVSNNVNLDLQLFSNGAYQSSNYLGYGFTNPGSNIASGSTGWIQLCNAASVTSIGAGVSGTVKIFNPNGATPTHVTGNTVYNNSASPFNGPWTLGYVWNGTTAITGSQIYFGTGNVASGFIRIYGIV